MTNKTRKHIRLGALVMSIAIVGFLAAFVVLANNPGPQWRTRMQTTPRRAKP